MAQIRKFIEWMSFHPSTEEIARTIASAEWRTIDADDLRIITCCQRR
jgi:hypothetical protein